MIEKRFKLEMTFRAVIDDADVTEADRLPADRMIKIFIKEAVRHTDVLLAHYKQNLLHVRVNDDEKHSLRTLLNMKEDDRHLLELAALCPGDVKDFIKDAFSPSDPFTPRIRKVEKEQAVIAIEDKLGPLQITNAVFTMLDL